MFGQGYSRPADANEVHRPLVTAYGARQARMNDRLSARAIWDGAAILLVEARLRATPTVTAQRTAAASKPPAP